MNSSYFKTMMAGLGNFFHEAVGTQYNPVKLNNDEIRRGLSATKKYKTSRKRGLKKIHNTIGSRFRGAVQIREQAVGVHWLKA